MPTWVIIVIIIVVLLGVYLFLRNKYKNYNASSTSTDSGNTSNPLSGITFNSIGLPIFHTTKPTTKAWDVASGDLPTNANQAQIVLLDPTSTKAQIDAANNILNSQAATSYGL